MTEIVLRPPHNRYGKPTGEPAKPTGIDCSICYERKDSIKWINCVMGGVQNIPTGKWKDCCEDKPICANCRQRCRNRCPFCSYSGTINHTLYNWKKGSGPKRKKPFAEAEVERQKKKLAKRREAIKKRKALMYTMPASFVQPYPMYILF
jgi:hypothetical protein